MATCRTFGMFLPAMIILLVVNNKAIGDDEFSIQEATVVSIQKAFKANKITSLQLVQLYFAQIQRHYDNLRCVIELNPDAKDLAAQADKERKAGAAGSGSGLHGIPILLKDNIATKDKLGTTAGSYALEGSSVPEDAGVVKKLRKAGAIILGKASLSEWAKFRSFDAPDGWCARSGQTVNPYGSSFEPGGSSTGSAVSVAANMVTVSLGTETAGSILNPSSANSVVGLKPTLGLTSRAGVIPISLRQDVVGTVADAVTVFDVIAGEDPKDEATKEAKKYIPAGGYLQFLKSDGIRGKRIGMTNDVFTGIQSPDYRQTFESSVNALSRRGADLIGNLALIPRPEEYFSIGNKVLQVLQAEFKRDLNAYLQQLTNSRVRSLADIIKFNKEYYCLEKTNEYGQGIFEDAEKTNGIDDSIKELISEIELYAQNGYEKLMKDNELDALVTPLDRVSFLLAMGGFPGITVPAGYEKNGTPFGICFSGLKGSEDKLIQIAYDFEQTTKSRKPPF